MEESDEERSSNKKRSPKAPLSTATAETTRLEVVLQNQNDLTRMVREDHVRVVERRITWSQVAQYVSSGVTKKESVIDVARQVLGMVEQVQKLCLELNRLPFRDVEALQERQIPIVDRANGQRVASGGRECTGAGSDVLSGRVVGQVGHRTTSRVHQRCHVRTRTRNARRIQDAPIASRVVVEVRVVPKASTVDRSVLRRLVGVDGADLPVSEHVLHEPAFVLEPRYVVNQ